MSLSRFTQEVSLFFTFPVCLLIVRTNRIRGQIVLDYHESIFAIDIEIENSREKN